MQDDRESRLQPEHARPRGLPLGVLVLVGVRGVVGRDHVDDALGQGVPHRPRVVRGAQRRVDLVDRVVAGEPGVGEQQVVRRHLRAHAHAGGLRGAQHVDRPGGGHVADVQPRAGLAGQRAVPRDDGLLRGGRPALQPQPGRDGALVGLCAVGEPVVLGVLGDDDVERRGVLQRAAHDQRVVDALPVVAEHPHLRAARGHRAELGELRALQPDGDRADRDDVHQGGVAPEPPHLLDHPGGVGDRVGVGHRVHGGEAAERRGARAGRDGLGVLPARLAQVRVQVDQARQRDQPGGVDDLGTGHREAVADRGDTAVLHQDVGGVLAVGAGALDQVGAHWGVPPSSR